MTVELPLHRVGDLSPHIRSSMKSLYGQIYQDSAQFDVDLDQKDWALLLVQDNQLVGFSTLQRSLEHFQGSPVAVYFSGDTLVLPQHRHRFQLPRLWARAVFELVAQDTLPCYWLLICSGFRTYRFLSVFYREFYPRYDQPTPPDWANFMSALAERRFGPLYDSQNGVVRLASACKEGLPERQLDPHAQFFLSANPGWVKGHELVCLTRLSVDNQSAALQRLLRG